MKAGIVKKGLSKNGHMARITYRFKWGAYVKFERKNL